MIRRLFIWLLCTGLCLIGDSCLDPYNAPTARNNVRVLVVDGLLNANDGTCTVVLSRTIPVQSFDNPETEVSASVRLVDAGGINYPLNESKPGTYTAAGLNFAEGDPVQLKITTSDLVEYESTVVPVLKVPPIDSLTYVSGRTGLTIQVNSHNNVKSKYYSWKFTETYYHTARYQTTLTLNEKHQLIPLTENIFDCWTTLPSSEILVAIASTNVDGTEIISRFPLATFSWESQELLNRFTIEVEQRVVSREAFDYLEALKKNTENLGTLFDPLPSSPDGNISCITNPSQKPLGNFYASGVNKTRIFIGAQDYQRPAGTHSSTGNEDCFLGEYRGPSDWFSFWPVYSGGASSPLNVTTKACVDCRVNGGTNVQPDFWQW